MRDEEKDEKEDRRKVEVDDEHDDVDILKESRVGCSEFDYHRNLRRYSPARCRSRSMSNEEQEQEEDEEEEEDDSENERDVNKMLECNAALDGDVNDINYDCDFDTSNIDRERGRGTGVEMKIR